MFKPNVSKTGLWDPPFPFPGPFPSPPYLLLCTFFSISPFFQLLRIKSWASSLISLSHTPRLVHLFLFLFSSLLSKIYRILLLLSVILVQAFLISYLCYCSSLPIVLLRPRSYRSLYNGSVNREKSCWDNNSVIWKASRLRRWWTGVPKNHLT